MQQESNDLVFIIHCMKKYVSKDIKNQKFNRLTAICFDHMKKFRSGTKREYWKFLCDCGKETVSMKVHVMYGATKSCGCFRKERTSEVKTTHGFKHTRFYRIWHGMRDRCTNKNTPIYKYYGGKGIKLKWKSFESFRDDMYKSYIEHCAKFGESQTEIDRIDFNGNYEKKNCRWVGSKIQCRNRGSIKLHEYKGEKLCLVEWAEKLDLPFHSFRSRIYRGWTISEAIERPYRGNATQ